MKKRDADDKFSSSTKTKIASLECKICGAPALHSNYGAITCHPCKMFFKRHVTIEQKRLICDFNNQCEININNRHICSACRLAKCFANGMQPELIRGPISKKKTTNQTTTNQSLTTDQRTLLTNLLHTYDEMRVVSFLNELVESSKSENDFLTKIFDLTSDFICSNKDFRLLSLDDRSNFLRNIAENVTCIHLILCWHQAKQIEHGQLFKNIVLKYYGENITTNFDRLVRLFHFDIILRKLAVSIFAFSINTTIVSSNFNIKSADTSMISRIQNGYIEILWNYLIDTYGYLQAIQHYNSITQCLSLTTNIINEMQSNLRHSNDMNFLIEKIELKLILDDLEHSEETR